MVSGKHKSRSMRRVFVKTPGGRKKIQYKARKPSKSVCNMCGDALKGVPNTRPSKLKNMAKSKKRPERPYAGTLCSKCSRRKIIESIS